MESGIALLAIFVIGLVVACPILAIAAFVRTSNLRRSLDQIPQLTSRLYDLEKRLSAIQHAAPSPSVGAPVTSPAPQQHPPVPAWAPPKPPVVPERRISAPPLSLPPRPLTDVESLIGGRWLYYVGILALAFAVTFFLKYAFDNNWIGPTGRVAIGLLVGSALFPVSNWILHRGYRYFSEGIAGLGAAILYLSIWAGWHYYHLFSQPTAFTLMIVVTAATTVVAIGRDSERIAVLGLIGGVLTPALVSTGKNEEVVLFTYLAILGAGMLGISWKRDWKWLPPVLFVSTLVYFWGWYGDFYASYELARTLLFASIFFLMFAALPAIRGTREGQLPVTEVAVVLANASNYLIGLRLMLWPEHRWGLTFGVLALALLHLSAGRMLPQRDSRANQVARILYAGLALVLATLAIPIRLEGHWITMAWAAEGAVLVWSGLRMRSLALRSAGFVMFLIVAVRICTVPITSAPVFLLNARFLTLAFCAAAAAFAFVSARRSGPELEDFERGVCLALAIAANVCFLVALSLDLWDAYGRMPSLGIDRRLAQELALSVLWVCYALALLIPGVRWKSAATRWQGLALLGVTIVKVFFFDLSFLARFYRIVSFFLLGLVLLLVSFYYQRLTAANDRVKK
ncbi:MAG TPA: DUF2339 domain-containing protein [Candidatus Acidoferrum sp.]|nr:DUF2339 domain-containing protein [Candidatus Acidoferrum sp.]HUL45451.1 DUF2339 domain-containing protein [Candidatus Bathyarchaeia archaeon]